MKYGFQFNINDSDSLLCIVFKDFDLNNYKIKDYLSEIYLIPSQECTYDLYGDNEIFEVVNRNLKHYILDLDALFIKDNLPSFRIYCYDSTVGVMLFENEDDYRKIKKNCEKIKNFKLIDEFEATDYAKYLADLSGE